MLFNVAGLIPEARYIESPVSKRRARLLQTVWQRCHRYYRGEMLVAAEWQFFRLRPENFPTVRIAGAVPIVARFLGEDVLRSIVSALREHKENPAAQLRLIEAVFTAPADDFWSSHYQFAGDSNVSLRVLIGKQRVRDIVLNSVIPVCLLYADCFRDNEVRAAALGLFRYARSLHDNFILRSLQAQLLKNKLRIDSAMLEQGAVQLYKNYCTEERCSACRIGRIVFRKR
jgi:hypothetical protein